LPKLNPKSQKLNAVFVENPVSLRGLIVAAIGSATTMTSMSCFHMRETVVAAIMIASLYAPTITTRAIAATGKIARNAESHLIPKYTSGMAQTNTTLKS